ncbi:hypothetical protein G5V57_18005 [Nordella sp. HKS 07]|uniref:CARDB domain-containing protein n=1 Tax=Nordella sp. HKS 07 TaxID=2712222 RepID=UPI0013E1A9C5|nr:CARDB domain-containing protein [Nordella sp. HKS 07]QIG49443.1 hypothetical protein G5V57_18005 [Nordella sp. HKS 07]
MPSIDLTLGELDRFAQRFRAEFGTPRHILPLPNLRINRITTIFIDFNLTQLQIGANIANVGTVAAGPFNVMTIIPPDPPLFQRVDGLAPGTAIDLVLTVLENAGGQETCVTVVVDPPTNERPYGEVFESNIEDNVLTDCFIVLKPPDKIPIPDDKR